MSIEGIGPQLQDNGLRGWLAFEYLPAELQRLEDSRAVADRDYLDSPNRSSFIKGWGTFDRPATDTERRLLAHIGFADLPEQLATRVEFLTSGTRRRTWPQLETAEGN
ncbi:hypothetical protein MN2019_17890 [Mycolicibacterium neoaurum]|uniref:hypothetical protein n=1 Tax=Mycolicibacterium neoaurum TaxID=1795 RepID=UPI001BCF7050|nr:hypothetical protein [Mycolicibacterium neoaurum]QVI26174.1 hypothetical protein MN2019_17890 [Mycolicibacterium neoaurum]